MKTLKVTQLEIEDILTRESEDFSIEDYDDIDTGYGSFILQHRPTCKYYRLDFTRTGIKGMVVRFSDTLIELRKETYKTEYEYERWMEIE